MKTLKPALRRTLRTGLLAAGLAAVIGGTVAPAFADADDWHRGREAREHEWREHERWEHRYVAPSYGYGYDYTYAYPTPYYGYSYAPAPVYTFPGLTLGFTFR
jgi:hypothetical protein